jgi:hypothetical protein
MFDPAEWLGRTRSASNRLLEAGQLAMVQILLIGIGAGAASALLFASVASGTALSVVLFYLAALPILIATIGWSTIAGLIAAGIAAVGLGVIVDWRFLVAFTLGVGAPAWWLGYLAMLARPAATHDGAHASATAAAPDTLEWYPPGRLVVWAAVLGALGVVAIIPYFGFDRETFESALRGSFERALRASAGPDGTVQIPGVRNAQQLLDILVMFMPLAAAFFGTIIHLFNLWLSARIVRMSGRLKRPWPDLPSMRFPPTAAGATALSLAGSFVPGTVGLVASIFAVALMVAYAVLGLAVLHDITRGAKTRAVTLGAAYALILFQGWPILIFSLFGLIDSAVDLRSRVAHWRGKPTNHS